MAEYLIKGETLTGIADAIREKTGGTDPVAVSDMAGKIAEIKAGGGDIGALIDRSITEISSNSATSIGSYAFYGCHSLITANFPIATSIGSYAFYGCHSLTTANSPVVQSIGTSAFDSCDSLTTANFPVAQSIGNSAFHFCHSLTTANFPIATLIGNSVFHSCRLLTTAKFPIAQSIGGSAFSACSLLTTVDFPVAISIGGSAFSFCSELKSLLLRNNGVCALSSTNAFKSTPIQSGTGYIYVPSELIEQYKTAKNWSTYASQFRALEDYTVDGTITGELDPAKTGT